MFQRLFIPRPLDESDETGSSDDEENSGSESAATQDNENTSATSTSAETQLKESSLDKNIAKPQEEAPAIPMSSAPSETSANPTLSAEHSSSSGDAPPANPVTVEGGLNSADQPLDNAIEPDEECAPDDDEIGSDMDSDFNDNASVMSAHVAPHTEDRFIRYELRNCIYHLQQVERLWEDHPKPDD